MMDLSLLIIGEVIEVRGQKVRVKVYREKNTSSLNYNGQMLKNVSVGGFIRIRKGFLDIIGRIEGEYIVENNNINTKYCEKKDTVERVIEISVVGSINGNGKFVRGLSELPLVANYAYILTEEQVQKVFAFCNKEDPKIEVGNIIAYEKYKLELGVQNLFGSHIGIFGNTGSGKSNTLAKIYNELFNRYNKYENFKNNSKFILIDFNGEYSKSITKTNKKVYRLSTRKEKDKYPLNKEYLFQLEFWSIILEATEKTQQPFLKRAIRLFKNILDKNITEAIITQTQNIIMDIFNYKDKYNILRKYYKEIIFLGFKNTEDEVKKLFDVLTYNSTATNLYLDLPDKSYLNSEEKFYDETRVTNLIYSIKESNCRFDENINYWYLFELVCKIQYINELKKGYVIEDHIAPLIRRLDTRIPEIEKVFDINESFMDPLNIISLIDVNIYMKKIIPMIICKKEYDIHKEKKNNGILNIIIDEAHNILSKESQRESSVWKDYRLEVFEEIIKEGRKFGVFLTIASQRPSDISDTIISQLHNYFLHRLVNNEDIKAIGRTVSFLDNASYEMIPILPQGACIFTGIASNFPVLVQIDRVNKQLCPESDTIKLNELWTD
ncbi:ATP-binding protein [Clostridium tyrobutyricum]|uniref:ATP-binding protein n=1 Tax=Clostridium tyrobutyricum TaxID=1519 RepID=UPI001C37F638|nr:ATP-binding protein [Clostridium tyrobutyricum]MBV4447888.1 ATP-binding protein [Clostridium tyrobutyricum]